MNDAVAQREQHDAEDKRQDAESVAKTLAGDTAAFDALIEKYQRRAVAVSYRLLGNIDDAMDVTQEAYVKAFKSLSTLLEPERFGAWLMRIVCNLSLNFRRGRHKTLSLSTGDDDDSSMPVEDATPGRGPDSRLRQTETERAVTRAMETLPEQQRMALVLFAIEKVPQKEVAEILECSVEMVKWNVFQARKKLKEDLADFLQE